nr:PucR family transcriptional regulator [Nocardioides thalensis]
MLRHVSGDVDRAPAVENVLIHADDEEAVGTQGAVVLGVGLTSPGEIATLINQLAAADAGALIVRDPVPMTAELERVVAEAPVVLLSLASGASWVQLTSLLLSLASAPTEVDQESGAAPGLLLGDLFSVANAISALVDAPVTIEDRASRVLAFSGRQDEADESRLQTILGRQVPDDYVRVLEQRGVFQRLYREDAPIYLQPFADGPIDIARVAVAVRAGDEFLGSIWAAVDGPLTPEREAGLRDAAKIVALHLLRLRAGSDTRRRLNSELMAAALTGGPAAAEALDRLGLSGRRLVVMALGQTRSAHDPVSSVDLARSTAERQWLHDAFAVHVGATHLKAATATIGTTSYAILPLLDNASAAGLRTLAATFLERTGTRIPCHVVITHEATNVLELRGARVEADRALRVLRVTGRAPCVAHVADVESDALLLDLGDLHAARGSHLSGPVERLRQYDESNGSTMLATLGAWFDSFGDVRLAAEAIHVHPNTFRYRLRRIAEIGQLDLDDPSERLAAMLQVRLLQLTEDSHAESR